MNRAPASAPSPDELHPGTWLIDTHLAGQPRMVGVFAQALPDGSVLLIESGSGATTDAVRAGLTQLGFEASDVAGIVLTHIHLDHAAGAGTLARWADAPVYVHPRGLLHLADPTRLWNSAERIYGDVMDQLWGPMEPVPKESLVPLEDRTELTVGGATYRILHTPGHAKHHLALLDPEGAAFVGDAAGILLPEVPLIRPALPPPETDLEAAEASCLRLQAADLERMWLTHFGVVTNVDAHLAQVIERNATWGATVEEGLRAGEGEDELIERIRDLEERELDALGVEGAARAAYKLSSDARMTVMGLERYWRTKDEA